MDYLGLLNECKQGNSSAQKKIYEQFAPAMFAICLRYARCQEDAEDIFQQAFIKSFQRLDQLADLRAFPGWLKSIFIREALDFYRQSHLKQHFEEVTPLSVNSSVENDAIENLNVEIIRKAINKLPDKCREVFNLFVIDGYSHKEIAEMMHITEGTAKSQLFEAKKRLKELLTIKESEKRAIS